MEDEDDFDKQVMNDVSTLISSLVSTAGLENIFRELNQDKHSLHQQTTNQGRTDFLFLFRHSLSLAQAEVRKHRLNLVCLGLSFLLALSPL